MKFQPTLVNHSVLRAYGIEHPIGDPFGGAAYGEMNKGGSLGGGLSGLSSILGGVAVIASGGTLAPLVGGLMIAGGAMTSIGAITGNNTLMNIGGITSTIGGIGAMGAGIYDNWDKIGAFFSSGTELSGEAAGAVVDAGAASQAEINAGTAIGYTPAEVAEMQRVGEMAVQATPASFQTTNAAFQGGSFADQMAGELGNQIMATKDSVANNVNLAIGDTNNWLASNQSVVDAGGLGSSANISGGSGLKMGSEIGLQPNSQVGLDTSGVSFGYQPKTDVLAQDYSNLIKAPTQNQGLLSSVGSFIEKNPMASMMGMQALSGLAQGASPKSQAEGDYLEAMTQLRQAESDFLNAQKAEETAANTEYLRAKAQEFEKTKAYAEEKRRLYNESIQGIQMPNNMIDYSSALFNRDGNQANAGIINNARA